MYKLLMVANILMAASVINNDLHSYKIMVLPTRLHTSTPTIEELTKRGHVVYVIVGSLFKERFKKMLPESHNIRYITYYQPPEREDENNQGKIMCDTIDAGHRFDSFVGGHMTKLYQIVSNTCSDMLSDNNFMITLRKLQFDLAFVDSIPTMPCPFIVPYNLSIPIIGQEAVFIPWLYKIPALPSFTPMSVLQYNDHMTFLQRTLNLGVYLVLEFVDFFPGSDNLTLLETFAPGIASYRQLHSLPKLTIVLRDHILEWPQPSMPHIQAISGITYGPANPLPVDLLQLMNGSKNGVVYISFGSVINKLKPRLVNKLLQAFNLETLVHYDVLFSYAGDLSKLETIPANVHIYKWIPQNDILGHQKTKVFVNHGGHNGQSEAVYHAVPMITLAIHVEQQHNAFRVQHHQYGLALDFYDFTPLQLEEAIQEILTNPVYRKNIQKASAIMKDMPKLPKEIVADRIEEILKHGGEHLMSYHVRSMPFYKMCMLDVLIVVVIVILLFLCAISWVTYCVCKFLYRYMRHWTGISGKTKKE